MLKKKPEGFMARIENEARTNAVRARHSEECIRFLAIRHGVTAAWVKLHFAPIIRETFKPDAHWICSSEIPPQVMKVLAHHHMPKLRWKGRLYYHPVHVTAARAHSDSWGPSKNRLRPQERKAHFPPLPDVDAHAYPKGKPTGPGKPSQGS